MLSSNFIGNLAAQDHKRHKAIGGQTVRSASLLAQFSHDSGCQLLPGLRYRPSVFGVQAPDVVVNEPSVYRGELG